MFVFWTIFPGPFDRLDSKLVWAFPLYLWTDFSKESLHMEHAFEPDGCWENRHGSKMHSSHCLELWCKSTLNFKHGWTFRQTTMILNSVFLNQCKINDRFMIRAVLKEQPNSPSTKLLICAFRHSKRKCTIILYSQLTSLRQNILERRFARCSSGLISYKKKNKKKKRMTKRVTFAAWKTWMVGQTLTWKQCVPTFFQDYTVREYGGHGPRKGSSIDSQCKI